MNPKSKARMDEFDAGVNLAYAHLLEAYMRQDGKVSVNSEHRREALLDALQSAKSVLRGHCALGACTALARLAK